MKVVIVGGSSGMGKGLALRHAAVGHTLTLIARSLVDLQTAQTECRAAGAKDVRVHPLDVTRLESCVELHRELQGGDIDVCYFAVGRGAHQLGGSAWAAKAEATDVYQQMLDVNFFGPLHFLRAFLPTLARCRAHCVFLNSASGIVGLPGRAAYCASKAALSSVCETLVAEAAIPITITEIFVVSVSGTNLRAKGIVQGAAGPVAHQGPEAAAASSSELTLNAAVDAIFKAAASKTRRVYLPSKLRLAPIVKHLPLIPADGVLDRLVWKKARL